ncbi:hypothetical protein MYX07_02925 [Patescibacteria group bacterium AH-259-L07]|nr:hypothetical protein [Patescibacteria group bacterium AH-259-L07]
MKEISSIWTRVMEIAQIVAEHSNGRIVMVFNKHDYLEGPNPEAGHFLKLDGIRFGPRDRDIEAYGMLAGEIGWQQTLSDFVDEIIVPLVDLGFMKSCKAAAKKLHPLGREIYPIEQHYNWDKFFKGMIDPVKYPTLNTA